MKEKKGLSTLLINFGSLIATIATLLFSNNKIPLIFMYFIVGYLILVFLIIIIPGYKIFWRIKINISQLLNKRKYRKYQKELLQNFDTFYAIIDNQNINSISYINREIRITTESYNFRNLIFRDYDNWYSSIKKILPVNNLNSNFKIISDFLYSFHIMLESYQHNIKQISNKQLFDTQPNFNLKEKWNLLCTKYNNYIMSWAKFVQKVNSDTKAELASNFNPIAGL